MVLHIVEATVCGPHSLELTFDDGTHRRVDVSPLLDDPIFEPLRELSYFARMVLDPVADTVVWPNEAGIAPEALYELEPEEEPASLETSSPVAKRQYSAFAGSTCRGKTSTFNEDLLGEEAPIILPVLSGQTPLMPGKQLPSAKFGIHCIPHAG
jgi:hypothetical protein